MVVKMVVRDLASSSHDCRDVSSHSKATPLHSGSIRRYKWESRYISQNNTVGTVLIYYS